VPDSEEMQEEIQLVQRAASGLAARLKPLASMRWNSADAPAKLAIALQKLGDPATFNQALTDTVAQGQEVVRKARARRSAAAGSAVAGFIQDVGRDAARETAHGWRVGLVELEVSADEGQVKALYDRAVVVGSAPVSSVDHVREVHSRATQALKAAELPDDVLVEVFDEAFEYLSSRRDPGMNLARSRVELQGLLREVRIVLVRRALQARRLKEATAALSMPPAALLYNADRYRAVSASIDASRRLVFEYGSQKETSRIGVTLNGLDPFRDYERFCYVERAKGA
jgi:hypothetical protein